jgi:hypothetical protein
MTASIRITALLVCASLQSLPSVKAFVPDVQRSRWTKTAIIRTSTGSLGALTERQLQFWEDVEEGLDDIANFWEKKGQDIDRIRLFGKRYVRRTAAIRLFMGAVARK